MKQFMNLPILVAGGLKRYGDSVTAEHHIHTPAPQLGAPSEREMAAAERATHWGKLCFLTIFSYKNYHGFHKYCSVASEARSPSDLSAFCQTPFLNLSTAQCYHTRDQAAQTSEGHTERTAFTCTFQSYRLPRRLVVVAGCGDRNVAVFTSSASPTGQYSEGGTFSATWSKKQPWEQNQKRSLFSFW